MFYLPFSFTIKHHFALCFLNRTHSLLTLKEIHLIMDSESLGDIKQHQSDGVQTFEEVWCFKGIMYLTKKCLIMKLKQFSKELRVTAFIGSSLQQCLQWYSMVTQCSKYDETM